MAKPAGTSDLSSRVDAFTDRNFVCRAHFDRITRSYLKQLLSDALIEEHRRAPSGRHSEQLGRLLYYFRRLPAEQQYLLRALPGGGYAIVRMTNFESVPDLAGATVLATLDAGYHGIFLLKLKDMMEADDG